MVIMYELNSVFPTMNSFAPSDFLLPQMNDLNLPFGKHGKFRSHAGCRNGLSKTKSQSVTRKKHSKEVELESKSSQCQIREQESDRYKIMNLVHQVNASKKTLDNNDVVSHCEETTETKIFIMEQRYGTVPARVAQMVWDRLKKLVGMAAAINPKARKFAVTGKGDENGHCALPNQAGLVINEKPLEEITLNASNVTEGSDATAMKKKRHFFKKLVTKGKRLEAPDGHEAVFQPIQSVSKIVNDVQTKNRLFELMDAKPNGIYQLPQVQCKANKEQSTSEPQPDQNTVKKFFIMKFILAKKKPSVQTQA